MEKFQEEEPIPIYEVPTEQLGYGNRILVRFRELVFGEEGGAEYLVLPFKKIRVSRELDDEIKDDVVKHEVNHYLDQVKEVPDKDDKRFAVVMLFSLGLALSVPYLPRFAALSAAALSFPVLMFYPLYQFFVVEERKADEGTVFEDNDFSWKSFLIYPVAVFATPFKGLSSVEEFWMERNRIFKKVRDRLKHMKKTTIGDV